MAKFKQTAAYKVNSHIIMNPIRYKLLLSISVITNILLIGYIYAS